MAKEGGRPLLLQGVGFRQIASNSLHKYISHIARLMGKVNFGAYCLQPLASSASIFVLFLLYNIFLMPPFVFLSTSNKSGY